MEAQVSEDRESEKSDRVLEIVQRQLELLSEDTRLLAVELRFHIEKSAERHSDLSQKIIGNIASTEGLIDGFPNGDTRAHREYHEALIEQAHARKEFWQKLSLELAKVGLIGFLIWAMAALWTAFLKGPK